jgi:hypothetical protein
MIFGGPMGGHQAPSISDPMRRVHLGNPTLSNRGRRRKLWLACDKPQAVMFTPPLVEVEPVPLVGVVAEAWLDDSPAPPP